MPEALDEELLRLQPEDFVGPDAIPKDLKEMEVKPASIVAEGDEIATKLVRAVKERVTVKWEEFGGRDRVCFSDGYLEDWDA
jgi:hypothetical protein